MTYNDILRKEFVLSRLFATQDFSYSLSFSRFLAMSAYIPPVKTVSVHDTLCEWAIPSH